jgi:hypothetical protein
LSSLFLLLLLLLLLSLFFPSLSVCLKPRTLQIEMYFTSIWAL